MNISATELQNFIRNKIIARVINIQILTTKYFSFQHSVTYCSQALMRPAHKARETLRLLTHETHHSSSLASQQS